MKQITVHVSKTYDIFIGFGILKLLGEKIQNLGNVHTVCIVSDSSVYPLYGQIAVESLKNFGLRVVSYVFPAGEGSKNPGNYLQLVNFLAENRVTRTDMIAALGGGVTGDIAGFAAATYLRGIRFAQIPTTLLAAVDSSVGGKTGIDLPAGKNLVGAFYQPSMVLCDLATLDSLPTEIFRDGCAEVIKYGVLYDAELFAHLERCGMDFDREYVVSRCVELKRNVVTEDEYDTGARMKLNLGHTFGHGVEAASNFALSHGKAVAIGMAIVSRACGCEDEARILSVLERFGLPTRTTETSEAILSYVLSDKKRSADQIKLILPRKIGDCVITSIPVNQADKFLKLGL